MKLWSLISGCRSITGTVRDKRVFYILLDRITFKTIPISVGATRCVHPLKVADFPYGPLPPKRVGVHRDTFSCQ